jgi:hypothetical protein
MSACPKTAVKKKREKAEASSLLCSFKFRRVETLDEFLSFTAEIVARKSSIFIH